MENIYIKANKNNIFSLDKNSNNDVQIQPTIYLSEVIKIWCYNKQLLSYLNSLTLSYELNNSETITVPILNIIKTIDNGIQRNPVFENIEYEIENLGQPDTTLTFTNPTNKLGELIKVALVCLIVFFGGAFAIMSFNEDVATASLFEKIYFWVTNKQHTGVGALEFFYSLGLMLGVVIFYNNFGRKSGNNNDPTPTEIKMDQYEQNVTDYLNNKKEKKNETHYIINNRD